MVDPKGKGKEIATKSSSGKRKSSRPPDGLASGTRKHRRSGALQFFDHIANVDDDNDEDDDSDSDFLSNDGMDLEDNEKQQKSNQIPFLLKEEEANDSELEKFIRERYKRGSKYVSHVEDTKGSDEENSTMQFNGGPIMWKVKCTRGHERELVVCLIQKFIDLHSVGKKMEIKSAFCLDHVKGHIYLEADRDSEIVEVLILFFHIYFQACKGLFGIYTNTMIHIPSNEIPYLFSVRGASMEVSKGEWVRVKHGTYKGDLAKVIDVDDRRKSATIKLVPRVDLQAVVNKTDGKKNIKRGTAVPAPHLISAYELEKLQQFVKLKRNQRTGEVFETIGGLTLKDGFLYKKVRLESLNCWDVRPSDIEHEQFKDSKRVSTKDDLWLSKLYGEKRNNKSKEVNKVDNGKGSSSLVGEKGNNKSKEVNKVDNGKGSSSLVSDNMREWELFDLVFLEKKRFGVIIGIDGDCFQILKGNCERLETTTVTMRDIKQQEREEETTSLDHNSNLISLNDVVRILKGPFKGKQGIVKHIIQGILFIYDNNQIEANGFCCAQTKNCEAIKYSHGPSDESFFGPVPPGFEASTSVSAEPEPEPEPEEPPKSSRQHRERPAAAGFRSRSTNGDFYVGQSLRIRVGPLKGYLCRVLDAYRSDITVKLDSQMKVIKVKVDDVTVVVAKGYGSVSR
ncbi:RNA-directed DNA methylation 3 protein [Nymphaea thermarum]|nr:RNA-directed DNA methylation 3 protein [Nymphaea thermarum]